MAIKELSADVLTRCRSIATSTWSDALDQLGISGVCDGLVMRSGSSRIAGHAVTVEESARVEPSLPIETFAIGDVIAAVGTGQVLVVSTEGLGPPVSTAGGLAARDAFLRGVAGFVIDGALRDLGDVRATGLFVASKHVTPRSGKRRIVVGSINEPIECGGVPVAPGDLVIGDETGVVIVPLNLAEQALTIAEQLADVDDQIGARLAAGETFSDVVNRVGPA